MRAAALFLNLSLCLALPAVADDGERLWIGLRSLLDGDETVRWHRTDKRRELVEGLKGQEAFERLMWFSRGYYVASRRDGALYVHDARFGSASAWLEPGGDYIFNFRLLFDPDDPGRAVGFVQEQPQGGLDPEVFRRLWRRLLGEA